MPWVFTMAYRQRQKGLSRHLRHGKRVRAHVLARVFVSATVVKHNGQFYIFPLQDYKEDRLRPLRSSKVKMKR